MEAKILFVIGGGIILTLLLLEILVGSRVIKANIKYHKYLGILIGIIAVFHGVAGLLVVVGGK